MCNYSEMSAQNRTLRLSTDGDKLEKNNLKRTSFSTKMFDSNITMKSINVVCRIIL